ncbi:thiaminase II [Microlunatus capsulatus]|uniref:Aminopyrimidine aminohydrolase n=1 Tax=Microlunatus capsulatus TaxID=99117 RepID=A0ABS4Z6F4_9ACTN|nr:thiaminase II [Microlunatus capsulatus]MBP2416634.1 thiaminase/transcriptional activator TenA [Microlunatus capsulatus]
MLDVTPAATPRARAPLPPAAAPARPLGSWSERLWAVLAPVDAAVLAHPFLTGVADGTLAPAVFTGYLVQDAHYLAGYARALALLGSRAEALADTAVLARHAAGTVEGELVLHAELLAAVGVDATALPAGPSPTTHAYTAHLLAAAALGAVADGVAAVLPCFWLYARAGAALAAAGSPEPRYQRWVDSYAGEAFAAVVEEVLALVDRLGTGLTAAQRAHAEAAALTSARYEWMFFDAALRQERWPV